MTVGNCGSGDCSSKELARQIAEERKDTDSKFERVFTVFQQSQTEQTASLKELFALNMQGMAQHVNDLHEDIKDVKVSLLEYKSDVNSIGDKVRTMRTDVDIIKIGLPTKPEVQTLKTIRILCKPVSIIATAGGTGILYFFGRFIYQMMITHPVK